MADPLQVGLIGAVPWAFGIVAMFLMARSADRRQEYRWHTARVVRGRAPRAC